VTKETNRRTGTIAMRRRNAYARISALPSAGDRNSAARVRLVPDHAGAAGAT
jgi:hypothetical protein